MAKILKNDIIIKGISINSLIEAQATIQQGAAKVISNAKDKLIELVKDIVRESEEGVPMHSEKEIEQLVELAQEQFDIAQNVSEVSGVGFYLPYYKDYDYSNDEVLSRTLGDSSVTYDFYELMSNLEGVESDSCQWLSSSARC